METRKWKVVDIYYKDGERDNAIKLAKYYEKQGYDNAEEQDGFDECDGSFQLIGKVVIREINQ